MDKSENYDNMDDKIKIFSSNESLKLLGELLSNKSSRDIIGLLVEKERYKNEIATVLNLKLNLVSHHLEKMELIGLVETSYKKITKKGEDHKFFRVNPKIFIMPNHSEKMIKEKGVLRKIFREGIKFAAIGIAGITTWFISTLNFAATDKWISGEQSYNDVDLSLVVIPLLVIIIGLLIERIYSIIKKND